MQPLSDEAQLHKKNIQLQQIAYGRQNHYIFSEKTDHNHQSWKSNIASAINCTSFFFSLTALFESKLFAIIIIV